MSGKRGPPSVPTETLVARGSWLAAARKGSGEPQFPIGIPEPPTFVPESTRDWFREAAASACSAGYMSPVYATQLGLAAVELSRFLEAEKDVRENGIMLSSEKGGAYANPAVYIAETAISSFMKITARFGFTPADKASLRVGSEPAKESGKGRFFKAG